MFTSGPARPKIHGLIELISIVPPHRIPALEDFVVALLSADSPEEDPVLVELTADLMALQTLEMFDHSTALIQ